MLAGECDVNAGRRKAAVAAGKAGIDLPHDFFDESSRDEGNCAKALAELLARYFTC